MGNNNSPNDNQNKKPIEDTLKETGNALIGCGCLLGVVTVILIILFGLGH